MFMELVRATAMLLALCTIQSFIPLIMRRHVTAGRIASGLTYGIVSVAGMAAPIVLAPGHIMDARSVVLAVAGLVGGPLAGSIAALVAGGYRFYIGGTGAAVGIAAVFVCVALGLAYREAMRRGWVGTRFLELMAFGLGVHLVVIGLWLFLPAEITAFALANLALPTLLIFTPATALLVWMMNHFMDHHRTWQSLEEANSRFHQLTGSIKDIFYLTTPDRRELIYVSPAFEEVFGRSSDHLHKNPRLFLESVHPEDRAELEVKWAEHKYEEYEHSYRIVRPDGSVRTVRSQAFPVRNAEGEVYRIAGLVEDTTEQEERLAQLRQAQKMEALGQLTGGVAHDFNNLLQVIQGYSELLRQERVFDEESLDAIMRASQRGSELTQRLLAFARRQPLSSESVDVEALVEHVRVLLEHTLGADIDFRTSLQPDLWPVMADAAQLENALVNLAINARDAMSNAGTLMVEAVNVPGEAGDAARRKSPLSNDRVRISVIDDGSGMSEVVRARVFEPFFTTKDVGRGSGLGLSMVYGFIQQSEGHVDIESQEGEGTTVSLYLPAALDTPVEGEVEQAAGPPTGSGQTVLVLEDEPDARRLAASFLETLGYRTKEAGTADEALAFFTGDDRDTIDAILCDVVLPGGVSGPEFVESVQADQPDLKVIFMSGFPAGMGRDLPIQGRTQVFLPKPFSKSELAAALTRAMAPRRRGAR